MTSQRVLSGQAHHIFRKKYVWMWYTVLQKWGQSTIGHEKDSSEVIPDHDVFCEQEKSETQISEKNSQFLRLMTEKVCPSDLNEETLNLKIDDVVSELAESLPKIGQFCISYLIKIILNLLKFSEFKEKDLFMKKCSSNEVNKEKVK